MKEGIFNEMPQLVEVFVIRSWDFAILSRGNHRDHSLLLCLLDNRIAVITAIRDKMLGINLFNQRQSLSAICSGTFCNKNSDRHTMRIHGQMDFGVEPPLVRLMS